MTTVWPIYSRTRVYVDPTGNDAAAGTITAPVATLGRAATLLPRGGAIFARSTEANPLAKATVPTVAAPIVIRPWDVPTWHIAADAGHALTATGNGILELHRGRAVSTDPAGSGVLAGSSAHLTTLNALDFYAEGGESGWRMSGRFVAFNATRCTGLGHANDGFNLHAMPGDPTAAGVATLIDCIGNDCGDEGVSPHEYVVLHIIGGEYRRNGQAGMAAVNNAVCHISGGAEFTENGQTANQFGGVYYEENASGSIDGGASLINNHGPGIRLATTGAVELGAYTSTGNGAPDDLG